MQRIIFKFMGGPLDGKVVVGESGNRDKEAQRYYALTHHGRPGQRFRTASEYAIDTLAREHLQEQGTHHFQQHLYEVTERIRNAHVTLVRIEYVER